VNQGAVYGLRCIRCGAPLELPAEPHAVHAASTSSRWRVRIARAPLVWRPSSVLAVQQRAAYALLPRRRPGLARPRLQLLPFISSRRAQVRGLQDRFGVSRTVLTGRRWLAGRQWLVRIQERSRAC
jgi:hypothetical protein